MNRGAAGEHDAFPRTNSEARGTEHPAGKVDPQIAPPEFAQEAGSPEFSKGGHAAGEPGAEYRLTGDAPLTEGEQIVRGSAEPPRREMGT